MNGKIKFEPVLLVHGGAWKIPDEINEASAEGVKEAAIEGYKVLNANGNAIDAVIKAVVSLEDNPFFDAGRGSVLNENKEVEMHAMVMRGDTCDVGGVLCIQNVKNPVLAAEIVLRESHHCLFSGQAGQNLAREHGLEEKPLDYFVTSSSKKELAKYPTYSTSINKLFDSTDGHDTVGAVALDCHGNLACATSTGGITAQKVGRVSDSPIAGSGGFADNDSAAVSTTGHGESILKVNLARMVSFYVENGLSPQQAIEKSLNRMKERVGGSGGVIAVDKMGRVGFHFTTQKMSWAKIGGESFDKNFSNENGDLFVEYGTDTNIRRSNL